MAAPLTAEQILGLAPDAGVASSARGLAVVSTWSGLGFNERGVWGLCKGSGSSPYQTQIDLAGPAFRCSCPSRKFPCKHGVALLLLFSSAPNAFEHSESPAWVREWLAKREAAAPREPSPAAPPKRSASRERTAAARESRVATGVAELDRWLRDLVRHGLADAQSRPSSYWSGMAARMIDAQAPGLARMVRELGEATIGDGWQGRVFERVAQLHLLLDAFGRIDWLPPATQTDLRTAIGWTQSQDELLAGESIRDRWMVLGRTVESDAADLRTQRTWLHGSTTDRPALLLHFAPPGQPLDRSILPGTVLDADLVLYPGAWPLRALIKERHGAPTGLDRLPGSTTIAAALAGYAAALAGNPWLGRFPLGLRAVTPLLVNNRWQLADADGRMLPLVERDEQGWRLLALSGGAPIAIFGEWDGDLLLPLAAMVDGGLYEC